MREILIVGGGLIGRVELISVALERLAGMGAVVDVAGFAPRVMAVDVAVEPLAIGKGQKKAPAARDRNRRHRRL